MRAARWTPAELNQLLSLVGDYPTVLIVARYRAWAKRRGYPERSAVAIDRRIRMGNASREPVGVWIQTGTLTQLLGVSYTTVDRWVRRGYVCAHKFPCADYRGLHTPTRYFKRTVIRELAKRQPELFAGVSRQNLYLLLEDERLADDISTQFPSRPGKDRRRVRCVETGRIYASCSEAARLHGSTRHGVWQAAYRGCRASRFRWEFVEQ